MPKAKRNIGQEILEGIRQLKRGEHGRVMKVPSVTTIREKTGLSQPRFAELLGVSVRTLQEWEQGRRAPSGAARTLLRREEPACTSRRCLVKAWRSAGRGVGFRAPPLSPLVVSLAIPHRRTQNSSRRWPYSRCRKGKGAVSVGAADPAERDTIYKRAQEEAVKLHGCAVIGGK